MIWVELVTALAVLQLFIFSYLVGKARHRHSFPAPAIVGNEMVERYIRVHMNTLEMIAVFLPFLWLASRYWDPRYVAAVGTVFIIGRIIYFQGYINPAKSRHTGFVVGIASVTVLILMTFAGMIRAAIS